MPGGYRFLDHMTDAVIEAYGPTMADAFENAAIALNDTMVDISTVIPTKQFVISARGRDIRQLLFEWLDKVLLILLIDRVVMRSFDIEISEDADLCVLDATAEGEPLNLEKHKYKVEIKAVTYHEMEILRNETETIVRFILDL